MSKRVIIVDYKVGNLFSVQQACDAVGIDASISSEKQELADSHALILPGVGAFKEAIDQLHSLDLFDPIYDQVKMGKPIFGICLGLQLLFTKSEEFGESQGLNLIEGTIQKFSTKEVGKVPHVGWNKISGKGKTWEATPLDGLCEEDFMYFVHSYHVLPLDKALMLSQTNYSDKVFCSSVKKDHIFATQFHPEKSAEKGLGVYRNWAIQNKLI